MKTQCRDTDKNGTFDAQVAVGADGTPKEALADTNGDGAAENRQVFEGGALARVEIDTNKNSKPDVVQYYAGNAVSRQCQDDDHNGTIDACFQGESPVAVSGVTQPAPLEKLSCGSAHELWKRF